MTEKMDQVQGFYLETQEFREARQATKAEYAKVNKTWHTKHGGIRIGRRGERILQILAKRDGWVCKLCGQDIDPIRRTGPLRPTRDHIIPVSEKGSNALSNLQLAHATCNHKRGNKPLDSDS
jgi:hypothetical protein